MTTATETKSTSCPVQPFTVEADHPRNCDLLLQSAPGEKLRSRIVANRTVTDNKSGQELIPGDQASALSRFPEIPGMRIKVYPEDKKILITDPLASKKDQDTLDRLRAVLKASPLRNANEVRGVPERTVSLDVDRLKTLCKELHQLVEIGHARIIQGPKKLEMDKIDKLPGDYLLDPGSRVDNARPRYEKDYERWLQGDRDVVLN